MKQNNHNTNTPIMPDSKNPSNQSNLLQYEAHIKLMYQYAIASFAGNVKLKDFIQARASNDFDILLKPFNNENGQFKRWLNRLQKEEIKSISNEFKKLNKSQQVLFTVLLHLKNEIGDKIPVDGFIGLESLALDFAKDYEVIDHINEKDRESRGGFRATLFRDINNNEYVLALAGIDATKWYNPFTTDWRDIAADGSLLFRKLPKFQYDSMINFYFRLKQNSYITKDIPLIVVGHSLGAI